MKRFLLNGSGNYIIFTPLGLLIGQAWSWSDVALLSYIIGAVPLCMFGPLLYFPFLEHFWYPRFGEEFHSTAPALQFNIVADDPEQADSYAEAAAYVGFKPIECICGFHAAATRTLKGPWHRSTCSLYIVGPISG